MSPGWQVEERFGPAAELHASWPSADRLPDARAVARCHPTGHTLVLGSAQADSVADPVGTARAGVGVARRRTGGGAVLVAPRDPVWIDAWVPVGDPLWEEDVSRAFAWLGAVWQSALRSLGVHDPSVRGAEPSRTRWSPLICFGGVGAGEVTVDGRKIVGLAQRRVRSGVWFQGACAIRWDPTTLLDCLTIPTGQRAEAAEGLTVAAVGVADLDWGDRPVPGGDAIYAAFLAHLP